MNSNRTQGGIMTSQEVMMSIPVSGIPKGYKVVAIRPARPGDIVVTHENLEQISYSDCPRIILEKLYNPGIPIPNGWKVWSDDMGDWGAAEAGINEWRISGLQHFPNFVPPPNDNVATVERQS
jgi:hypothetical protein